MYYVTLSTTNDVTLNHGKKGRAWAKILQLRWPILSHWCI